MLHQLHMYYYAISPYAWEPLNFTLAHALPQKLVTKHAFLAKDVALYVRIFNFEM